MSLAAGTENISNEAWRQPPSIKVVGIYEDLASGLQISRLCAQLSEDSGRRVRFEVDLYSFDVLNLPAAAIAISKAREADAIVVSVHSQRILPLRIRKWLKKAEACTLGGSVEFLDDYSDSPAHRHLHQLAEEAANACRAESRNAATPLVDCISVSAMDEEERGDVAHYGIND